LLRLELPDELIPGVTASVLEAVREERRGWMSTATAAVYLDTSEQALRSLVKRGAVPVHRVGGRLLFSADELDGWVLAA
jgi:excisionase family DNA binding protein